MGEERSVEAAGVSTASSLLVLGRADRQAARSRLRELPPEELARLTQELRPSVRPELLMLMERPEEVVPLLPEVELATTIRASGMSEASWLIEIATAEQRVACIDVDCWTGYELLPERLAEWVDALIEAGRPTLVRALDELDAEVWVLAMCRMSDVVVTAKEEEPPDGYFTEDGVVHFRPRSDEDFARVKEIAQASVSGSPVRYWQLVYGMLFESRAECEEFALKWRRARMTDLGFPEIEQAMRSYRPLAPEQAEVWEAELADSPPSTALLRTSALPRQLRGSLLARALGELPQERAADVLGYVLGVVNSIAVADGLPLGDPDSIPGALEKVVRGIDRGLEERARSLRQPPHVVLESTRPLDLFRIGATLDASLRRPAAQEPYAEEDEPDAEEEA